MRALLTNHGFTISVFVAVAITAMFAFVFEAAPELVAALLVLGILTAAAEYVMRSSSGAPAVTATTLIHPVSASASDGTDGRESCR